jgi:predicted TIM-barrel fold metal-dependent hydrolase
MIIDVHTHIGHSDLEGDFPSVWQPKGVGIHLNIMSTKGKPWEGRRDEYIKGPTPFSDATGEESYKALTEIGVDKAILLTLDFTLISKDRYHTGAGFFTSRSVEEVNKHIADVAAKYPDKYIAFAGIDPRYGQRGLQLLRIAVQEWGVKGVKLHPTSGWYPNDRELCYPLYELCCDLDIPILSHCGLELYPLSGKWADPIFWDEVAGDFPEMRICLAHLGGGFGHVPSRHYIDIGLSLASIHDNVFLDTAGAQGVYARDPVEFYQELRRGFNQVAGKIMWGTDNPWLQVTGISWKQGFELFRNPDASILERAGVSFTKEEIDGLLGENAKYWLKLE